MSRATALRLARLEAKRFPSRPVRCFQTHEQDDAAREAWKAALIASGEAVESDIFIQIRYVCPPPREGHR